MEWTGISQAFVDFIHASKIRKPQKKGQHLKFCTTCKETDFGIFMHIKYWYNFISDPVFGTIMSFIVKKRHSTISEVPSLW